MFHNMHQQSSHGMNSGPFKEIEYEKASVVFGFGDSEEADILVEEPSVS